MCRHVFARSLLTSKIIGEAINSDHMEGKKNSTLAYRCHVLAAPLEPTFFPRTSTRVRREDLTALLGAIPLELVASIRVIERFPVRANWLIRNWDQRCGKTRWTATKGNDRRKGKERRYRRRIHRRRSRLFCHTNYNLTRVVRAPRLAPLTSRK